MHCFSRAIRVTGGNCFDEHSVIGRKVSEVSATLVRRHPTMNDFQDIAAIQHL